MSIHKYLTSLGSSSQEVADTLRKQKIVGVKCSTGSCPIINAIYKFNQDIWPGLRIQGSGKSGYQATFNDLQISDPTLPQPVIAFIKDFDEGLYPDLESQVDP